MTAVFGSHEDGTLAQLADVAQRAERVALMADGHTDGCEGAFSGCRWGNPARKGDGRIGHTRSRSAVGGEA